MKMKIFFIEDDYPKNNREVCWNLLCFMVKEDEYREISDISEVFRIGTKGAFDRVSRSNLIKKLVILGAGTEFTVCIASIYMSTENKIFQRKDQRTYFL